MEETEGEVARVEESGDEEDGGGRLEAFFEKNRKKELLMLLLLVAPGDDNDGLRILALCRKLCTDRERVVEKEGCCVIEIEKKMLFLLFVVWFEVFKIVDDILFVIDFVNKE